MKNVISTNLREDGVLEIYYGDAILCEIEDGKNDEDFIEDVLDGMGYVWNNDGSITKK